MTDNEDRMARVRARIRDALDRSGEPGRAVVVVAVTKGFPASVVDRAAAAGFRDIGENRVQEALRKAPRVQEEVRWHMIGHLQRNKARRAAELFRVVHSVDSDRLAAALGKLDHSLEVFLQVNVSGEASKGGVPPEEARALWRRCLRADNLRVQGLMTIAPFVEDPEEARPVFRALRELRDDLSGSGDGPPLRGLSMGMSNDFEVALEEGATHLRLGTALLGPRREGGPDPG